MTRRETEKTQRETQTQMNKNVDIWTETHRQTVTKGERERSLQAPWQTFIIDSLSNSHLYN